MIAAASSSQLPQWPVRISSGRPARPHLLDLLPPLDLDDGAHEIAVAVEEVEALAQHLAEVAEAAAGDPAALRLGGVGIGEGEMVEGAAAVAPGERPAEGADRPAGPLRGAPGQPPEGGGEQPRGRR